MGTYRVPVFIEVKAASREAARQEVESFLEYGMEVGNDEGVFKSTSVAPVEEVWVMNNRRKKTSSPVTSKPGM